MHHRIFDRSRRRRLRRRLLTLAGVVLVLLMAGSAMAASNAEGMAASGKLDVRVRDGRVSLEARAVPLGEVLGAIASRTGFTLIMKQPLPRPVSLTLDEVPVERAVARLLAGGSYLSVFAPGGGNRLAEVRVLRPPPPAPSIARPSPDDKTPARVVTPADSVEPHARRRAITELGGKPGRAAVPALANALADVDPMVRRRAVQGLARVGDGTVIAPLSRALLEDREPAVRRAAAAGLARTGHEQAFWALLEAQSDQDASVREAVASALRALDRGGLSGWTPAGESAPAPATR